LEQLSYQVNHLTALMQKLFNVVAEELPRIVDAMPVAAVRYPVLISA
jgi:hypothetical protein